MFLTHHWIFDGNSFDLTWPLHLDNSGKRSPFLWLLCQIVFSVLFFDKLG